MHIIHLRICISSPLVLSCFVTIPQNFVQTRDNTFSNNHFKPLSLPVSVVSDVILPRPGDRRASLQGSSRRSSSEVIKRMLYGSATKEDLKNRDVIESMDDESDVTTDTETDTGSVTQEEIRRKNLFILKKTTSAGRINFKMRRNSVEDSSERDGSPSPPLNPERPRLAHSSSSKTLPRRTKSSSNTNISSPATLQKSTDSRKTSYAFGSSTERFCNKPENDSRSSQDNLSGPGNITTQFIRAPCFHIPPSLRFSDGAGTRPDSAK